MWIHLQISMSALTGHYALVITSYVSICREHTDVHAEMVIVMLMENVKVINSLLHCICMWVYVCVCEYMCVCFAFVCVLCICVFMSVCYMRLKHSHLYLCTLT